MSLEILPQCIVNGLVSAWLYILVALGLTLVLSITGIVQLAHGEVYMLGAYGVYYLCAVLGLPFFIALVLSTGLVGLVGIGLERVFFRPFRGQIDRALIIAIGLIILLQNTVLVLAGGTPKAAPSPFPGVLVLFGVRISWERVMVILVAMVLVAGLLFFIHKTRVGQAMIALSQDREAAALQGIHIDRISSLAMFLGCALAAAAGGLVGALFDISPLMGGFALMKGIAVIILGGLGSIVGAVCGGLIIGLIDGLVPPLLNSHMASLMGFGVIIVVLLFRPQGLFGHE